MFELFLNHLTRNLPEKYKATYKRDFYNKLYFGNKWSFYRAVSLAIFFFLIGTSIFAVFSRLKPWYYPLLLFSILLVGHFLVTIKWTTIQTSYMWKNEVLIPKKYNKIALVIAFILFALTVYILYLHIQKY